MERRSFIMESLSKGATEASALALAAFFNEEVVESGEKVQLLSVDGQLVEIDRAYLKPVPDMVPGPGVDRQGIPGKRFVMVIDLGRCKNLRKCHDACESMHQLTEEMEWLKVLKMKDNDKSAPYWQPTMCFHCDEPPCVKVCPVDATFKRSDGIVLIDNERCIGCRFCMVACPYSLRVFQWGPPAKTQAGGEHAAHVHEGGNGGLPHRMGTVSKCDFCPEMAKKGEVPHCVSACPNGVFFFGDENEDAVSNGAETFRLSELLRDRAGYRFMENLGTKPRVFYLPPVNRNFPFEDDEFTRGKGE